MTTDSTVQLDDRTFLTQFENQTLDPVHFDHIGHLRLAWLYLNSQDVEDAVQAVCTGIDAYASSLGAHTKFHLTITDALVRIMAQRLEQRPGKSWADFLEDNNDLVRDAVGVLSKHFSRELLFSETARTTLVKPDLRPL